MGVAADGDLGLKLHEVRSSEPVIVKHLVVPLLSVCAHLHSLGVLHRDIKKDNILLHSSHVLLADFGFAFIEGLRRPVGALDGPGSAPPAGATGELHRRVAGPNGELIDSVEVRPVSRLGTLGCMAPDILLNDPRDLTSFRDRVPRVQRQPYTSAVDVWALGVVLFEVLVHGSPFSGDGDAETIREIVSGGVDLGDPTTGRPPNPALSGLSPGCLDFLRRCLDRDADRRATMHELYDHSWVRSLCPPDKWDALHPRRWTELAPLRVAARVSAPESLPVGAGHTIAAAAAAVAGRQTPAVVFTSPVGPTLAVEQAVAAAFAGRPAPLPAEGRARLGSLGRASCDGRKEEEHRRAGSAGAVSRGGSASGSQHPLRIKRGRVVNSAYSAAGWVGSAGGGSVGGGSAGEVVGRERERGTEGGSVDGGPSTRVRAVADPLAWIAPAWANPLPVRADFLAEDQHRGGGGDDDEGGGGADGGPEGGAPGTSVLGWASFLWPGGPERPSGGGSGPRSGAGALPADLGAFFAGGSNLAGPSPRGRGGAAAPPHESIETRLASATLRRRNSTDAPCGAVLRRDSTDAPCGAVLRRNSTDALDEEWRAAPSLASAGGTGDRPPPGPSPPPSADLPRPTVVAPDRVVDASRLPPPPSNVTAATPSAHSGGDPPVSLATSVFNRGGVGGGVAGEGGAVGGEAGGGEAEEGGAGGGLGGGDGGPVGPPSQLPPAPSPRRRIWRRRK